jgi:hypothetical protein
MDKNIQAMIESFKESNPSSSKDIKFVFEGYICPYFTMDEVAQLEGYYSDNVNKEYRALYEHIACHDTNFGKSWASKVVELQNQLKVVTEPEHIDQIKQELIDLGWNPEIEYTAENQIKAKKRYENILNERYNRFNIVDCTNINISDVLEESNEYGILYPIHIVLVKGDHLISNVITKVTNGDFSHSGLALDNDLNKIYSFNFDNKFNTGGGFSLESIKEYPKNNRLAVYTVFVTKQAYDKVSENLQNFMNNIKKTGYSIVNLVTFPFKNIKINMSDNMICSQFVDYILNIANVNITKDDASKVSPNGLYFAIKSNPKAYKVFDGEVKDFDAKKINKTVKKISKTASPANEIQQLEQAIFEARKIPVEINADGDVLLTNPFPDYSAEYFASHKLLLNYEKTGNIEGMKYELARLYYMNYIIEKKLYHNKNLKNKQENIKTRARILNDFNKYLKYVLSKDKNFNFSEYYEGSPFYAHTIEIKSSTIGKIKDIISYIL